MSLHVDLEVNGRLVHTLTMSRVPPKRPPAPAVEGEIVKYRVSEIDDPKRVDVKRTTVQVAWHPNPRVLLGRVLGSMASAELARAAADVAAIVPKPGAA